MDAVIAVKPIEVITLIRLGFSPLALRIDELAGKFEKDSVIAAVLRSSAQVISRLTCKVTVQVTMTEADQTDYAYLSDDELVTAESPHSSPWLLSEAAIAIQSRLFHGRSVALNYHTGVALSVILLWGIGGTRSYLESYTVLKRAASFCQLPVEHRMAIPMACALYRKGAYFPSPGLVKVYSSIVKA